VPTKKPRRPRFVPQVILASTAFAGMAVVPAVAIDCGGKTDNGVGASFVVAAVFDAATSDARASGVAASFEGGFSVFASFDAGSDSPEFTVAAAFDSGPPSDAPEFVVAANIAPKNGDDGSGHG
jgi:hypothetical protein